MKRGTDLAKKNTHTEYGWGVLVTFFFGYFFHFFPLLVAVLNFYDIIFTRIFGFTSIICRMYILKVCGILFSHVIAFIDIILRVQFFLKYLRQRAEEKNLLHSHSLYFCDRNLIYLAHSKHVDRSQALYIEIRDTHI